MYDTCMVVHQRHLRDFTAIFFSYMYVSHPIAYVQGASNYVKPATPATYVFHTLSQKGCQGISLPDQPVECVMPYPSVQGVVVLQTLLNQRHLTDTCFTLYRKAALRGFKISLQLQFFFQTRFIFSPRLSGTCFLPPIERGLKSFQGDLAFHCYFLQLHTCFTLTSG